MNGAVSAAARGGRFPKDDVALENSTAHGVHKYKGNKNGALYDDYAHHPTEIRATHEALRGEYPQKRIIVAYQPHLYSRTRVLLKDFAKSFKDADLVILADIYAAREIGDGTIHSRDLATRIGKRCLYLSSFNAIVAHLKKNLKGGDILVTMGAGDIYKIGEDLF